MLSIMKRKNDGKKTIGCFSYVGIIIYAIEYAKELIDFMSEISIKNIGVSKEDTFGECVFSQFLLTSRKLARSKKQLQAKIPSKPMLLAYKSIHRCFVVLLLWPEDKTRIGD